VTLQRQQLVERLIALSDRLTTQLRPPTAPEWADTELTMPQLRVVFLLGQEPQRMSDLATFLGTGMPSTTSMVKRLEAKGLVERIHDLVDRRIVMCRLTDLGQAHMERMRQMQRLNSEEIASVLDFPELVTVVEALELISRSLERSFGPPASPTLAAIRPGTSRAGTGRPA
jgi:DNA-binding MarR family transcriptional regulator